MKPARTARCGFEPARSCSVIETLRRLAVVQHSDDGVRIGDARRDGPVLVNWLIGTCKAREWTFDDMVELTPGMFCRAGKPKVACAAARTAEEDRQIEGRSEVHVETFSPLAGEDLTGVPAGVERSWAAAARPA